MPERQALADLEFKNRDMDAIDDAELIEDRIRSLELRLALYKLNIPKVLNKRIQLHDSMADEVSESTSREKQNWT